MKRLLTTALALCVSAAAHASSVSTEVTAGRSGYVSWGLLGGAELIENTAFLALGYNLSRTNPDDPLSHQLSLAVDFSTLNGWTFLAGASRSPSRLQTVAVTQDIFFRSSSAFVGGLVSAGFQHSLNSKFES